VSATTYPAVGIDWDYGKASHGKNVRLGGQSWVQFNLGVK
jgi:hypothetical protein